MRFWMCVLLFAAACEKSAEPPKLRSKEGQLSAVKPATDEDEDYVAATTRTARAGGMEPEQFRASVRELAVRCKRSKVEVYKFLRGVARSTGDLNGAIESAPAYCELADKMDRPLAN